MNEATTFSDYLPPPGSAIYYALLFLPSDDKPATHALFALRTELANIPRRIDDPGVARLKLQWWRDELQRLYEQKPIRHPIAQQIQIHCPALSKHAEGFEALIRSLEQDLIRPLHADYAALRNHYARGAGRFLAMTACLNSYPSAGQPTENLIKLATDLELIQSLQRLRSDSLNGYLRLPADEIPTQPLGTAAIPSMEWQAYLRNHTQRLRTELNDSLHVAYPNADLASLHLLVLGAIQLATLDEILRDGCRLLKHSIELTPLRMLWIAWRTQRRVFKRQGFRQQRRGSR